MRLFLNHNYFQRSLVSPSLLRALHFAVMVLCLFNAPSLLADDTGTPEAVTVVVIQEGEAVEGMELRVVGEPPGGGEITYGKGKTDAAGEFSLMVPWKLGLQLWAEGEFDGVRYSSPKDSFAGNPGAGLVLRLEVFKQGGAASLSDLSFGIESHIIIEIQEGFLDVTEFLMVQNNSKSTFAPTAGLQIPLPADFRKVRGQGGKAVFPLEHIGAEVPGPFLPGNTDVQIRYEIPIKSSSIEFEQKLNLSWPAARVIIDELKGLEFVGAQVSGQELRESQGRQIRLVSFQPADGKLSFELKGLPVRNNSGRWVALASAVLVGLIGMIFGILPVREEGEALRSKQQIDGLMEERSQLLAELEELEIEHAKAGDEEDTEDYLEDRELLVDKLGSVLRAIHDQEQAR